MTLPVHFRHEACVFGVYGNRGWERDVFSVVVVTTVAGLITGPCVAPGKEGEFGKHTAGGCEGVSSCGGEWRDITAGWSGAAGFFLMSLELPGERGEYGGRTDLLDREEQKCNPPYPLNPKPSEKSSSLPFNS